MVEDSDANIDVNMPETDFRASRAHKLLGNPLRYRMLKLIEESNGKSTSELSEILDRSLDTISYHADKLKEIDLVYRRKEGKTSHIHIKRNDLFEAIESFEKLFKR